MQKPQDTGALKWIGTCSDLNASYAADGYARLNGLGAVLVTNGVGALSAINGVGGTYSEHIPVICIAGRPPDSRDRRQPTQGGDKGKKRKHPVPDQKFDEEMRGIWSRHGLPAGST